MCILDAVKFGTDVVDSKPSDTLVYVLAGRGEEGCAATTVTNRGKHIHDVVLHLHPAEPVLATNSLASLRCKTRIWMKQHQTTASRFLLEPATVTLIGLIGYLPRFPRLPH
jgi:hypothetical protein